MTRFTVTGSPALEKTIAEQLGEIVDDLHRKLPRGVAHSVVLGGGYGRGEGGAYRDDAGRESPFNDYDLVLVHGAERVTRAGRAALRKMRVAVAEVERVHRRRTKIHVDILPLHEQRMPKLPHALTWFDLGRGHRILWGDSMPLVPLTRQSLESVDPTEWGRLLMNRAVGLAFARWVLRGEPCSVAEGEDPEAFIHRQLQKAWLSLGDVWLADRGCYDTSVRQRRHRFDQSQGLPPWANEYRGAVEFKLSPHRAPARAELARQLAHLAQLYAPHLRARRASPPRPAVGLLATVRHVEPRAWRAANPTSYPRERVRLALAHELEGNRSGLVRLTGSPEGLVRLWRRYG